MSIVVFDGLTVAADRMISCDGVTECVTKLFIDPDRTIFGLLGGWATAIALMEWYRRGADPEKWPTDEQRLPDHGMIVVVTPDDTLLEYCHGPYTVPIDMPANHNMYATGAGRSFAYGAMYQGATAVEAVRVACRFDNTCGKGCSWVDLADRTLQQTRWD